MEDNEPYNYIEKLKSHLGDEMETLLRERRFAYPRQIELHLPGDNVRACNFHCGHCSGKNLEKRLGNWEDEGIKMLSVLEDRIPWHIYSGIYTEPLLNPKLMHFIETTKANFCHYGLHTNGALLYLREQDENMLTRLSQISDGEDYISISLDAGFSESYKKIKGINSDAFDDVFLGIQLLSEKKERCGLLGPNIRLTYLMGSENSSPLELERAIKKAEELDVNSIRFSLPFPPQRTQVYPSEKSEIISKGKEIDFKRNLEYALESANPENVEVIYADSQAKTYELMNNFSECWFPYYQLTIGADGCFYRCSCSDDKAAGNPRITDINLELEDIKKIIAWSQEGCFSPQSCLSQGIMCNRVGLTLNGLCEGIKKKQKAGQ